MRPTDWFSLMATSSGLHPDALEALHRDGFTVIPGPVSTGELKKLATTYDKAVLEAGPSDTKHGSTTIRVHDLAMLARTLRPESPADQLHQDFPRDGGRLDYGRVHPHD